MKIDTVGCDYYKKCMGFALENEQKKTTMKIYNKTKSKLWWNKIENKSSIREKTMKLINEYLKSINKLPIRLKREEDRRKEERRLKGRKKERKWIW